MALEALQGHFRFIFGEILASWVMKLGKIRDLYLVLKSIHFREIYCCFCKAFRINPGAILSIYICSI